PARPAVAPWSRGRRGPRARRSCRGGGSFLAGEGVVGDLLELLGPAARGSGLGEGRPGLGVRFPRQLAGPLEAVQAHVREFAVPLVRAPRLAQRCLVPCDVEY